jgi:hypothetical protein
MDAVPPRIPFSGSFTDEAGKSYWKEKQDLGEAKPPQTPPPRNACYVCARTCAQVEIGSQL